MVGRQKNVHLSACKVTAANNADESGLQLVCTLLFLDYLYVIRTAAFNSAICLQTRALLALIICHLLSIFLGGLEQLTQIDAEGGHFELGVRAQKRALRMLKIRLDQTTSEQGSRG